MNALIIDDNRETADGLKKILSLFEIDAEIAYGSAHGLAALGEKTPEAVFLDINMPGMSGLEIMAQIKNEPRLSEVPVIIITSDDQEETTEKVRQGGALAMIIKPITYAAVERVLQKTQLLAGGAAE
ncbi:MAG: response regulator [Anaerolineae bacterium]|nr:response regulator [Anaerolineae bacterium]